MTNVRISLVVALTLLSCISSASAKDLLRYRSFALGSDLPTVAKVGGLKLADARTVHSRPALIQELDWRPPYVLPSMRLSADPVQQVVFGFYNGQLFRMTVAYDRERVEGLTDEDMVSALSLAYGAPILHTRQPEVAAPSLLPGSPPAVIVAEWDEADSQITLSRGVFPVEFRLTIVAKRLSGLATAATAEAVRRDVEEAPQREADRRKQGVADAAAAAEKIRTSNKAAFRP